MKKISNWYLFIISVEDIDLETWIENFSKDQMIAKLNVLIAWNKNYNLLCAE